MHGFYGALSCSTREKVECPLCPPRQEASSNVPASPAVPLLEEDVDYWLRQFGGESALTASF